MHRLRLLAGFAAVTCAAMMMVTITQAAPGKQDHSTVAINPSLTGNSQTAFIEGRETFRFDTFGDQDFWGGTLQLHKPWKAASSVASAHALIREPRWLWA